MKMPTVEKHLDLYTTFLVSNFLHRFYFFRGTKKQQTRQKIVCVPRLKCLPLYSVLLHTHFLVRAGLNGGKLQHFLHLVKQEDTFSKQFAEQRKGKTNLGDLHGIYHRKWSWRACYFKSAFKLSTKINKQNKGMKLNNTCTLRMTAKLKHNSKIDCNYMQPI